MALDVTGQKFGMLTAVRPTAERSNGSAVWEWRCDCGNTVLRSVSRVKGSSSPHCGCVNKKDITGQRFGMLTAVRPASGWEASLVMWDWQCDCGNVVSREVGRVRFAVKRGFSPNCGCLGLAAQAERERLAEKRMAEMVGQRFGMLTAVRPTEERSESGKVLWQWKCDCGNTVLRTEQNVRNSIKQGCVPSCGCRRKKAEK